MMRCLVVDDELLVRESVSKKIGECHSFIVSGTANNGAQALKWLQTSYSDICITDVKMPLMDGLEVIQEINARYPWMVNIIISSYDEFEYAKKAINLGAVDYILKPVKTELLHKALLSAKNKIEESRANEAKKILIEKLTHSYSMKSKWMDQLVHVHRLTMPTLLIDTLEMLEQWIGPKFYLLEQLAKEWIAHIYQSLREIQQNSDHELMIAKEIIAQEADIRRYYRLSAVNVLEMYGNKLLARKYTSMNQPMKKAILDIKQYINKNYYKKLSLQDISVEVSISRTYLANLFKQETGMTIGDYLVEVRMQKAKELLLTTDMKSYEVGNAIGYDDGAHFSRVFRSFFKMNPMEFKSKTLV